MVQRNKKLRNLFIKGTPEIPTGRVIVVKWMIQAHSTWVWDTLHPVSRFQRTNEKSGKGFISHKPGNPIQEYQPV